MGQNQGQMGKMSNRLVDGHCQHGRWVAGRVGVGVRVRVRVRVTYLEKRRLSEVVRPVEAAALAAGSQQGLSVCEECV